MFEPPYPQARRYIPNLHLKLRVLFHLGMPSKRVGFTLEVG
jgi:hypothetical protein